MNQITKGVYSRPRKCYPVFPILIMVSLFIFSSCGFWAAKTSHYDPVTYKSLTDLKPELKALYDSFGTDTPDTAGITAVRLKLAQMHEYELGKGKNNAETTELMGIIQNMFERHVQDGLANGPWNKTHLENCETDISKLFDQAIDTERVKNKGK